MNYYTEITYDILADDYVICFIILFEIENDGHKFVEYFNNYISQNKNELLLMYIDNKIKNNNNNNNKDKKNITCDDFNKIIDGLHEFNKNIENKTTSGIYSYVKNKKFNNEYIDAVIKFID